MLRFSPNIQRKEYPTEETHEGLLVKERDLVLANGHPLPSSPDVLEYCRLEDRFYKVKDEL